MTLETTKTTYLNGSSKDGSRVLANFSSSLSESGTMTINETISENANLDTLDTVEADFNEFRELAKNELKKLNTQDTDTGASIDKPVDTKPVDTTKVDDKPETVVKDDKPVDITTKTDDKSDVGVSSDKTGNPEVATTTPDNEAVKDDKLVGTSIKTDDKPETGAPDESKVLDVKDSEVKQPTSSEETNQPISGEEVKQPVVNEEAKVSDVKDGENADESNQLRHQ